MPINIKNRTIFCNDNLNVLKGINSNAIDLIYLDPPFNKKKTFAAPLGSNAEGAEFEDIFRLEDIKAEWIQTIEQDNEALYNFINGIKLIEGKTSYNFCYLCYMAIRLIECHRILKPTGSIYLHCDPTMSHYLKLVLDCIFGEKNFKNHVIWAYKSGGTSKSYFARKHDDILFYSKSKNYYFKTLKEKSYNRQYKPYKFKGVKEYKDLLGWYTLVNLKDVWNIDMVGRSSKERTGYPTQKPLALLERIIQASCPNEGIVLDPFCGCATTCVAAEKLERKWIGIDVSLEAYKLVQERLKKEVHWSESGQLIEKALQKSKAITLRTNPPQRTDEGDSYLEKKWIYVISNRQYPGEYKVGVAKYWQARLNSYQTSDPNRGYKMEYKLETAYFNQIEKAVHDFFINKHEWVKANLEDIKHKIIELNNLD